MRTLLATTLLFLTLAVLADANAQEKGKDKGKKPTPGKLLATTAVGLKAGTKSKFLIRGTDLEPATEISLGDSPVKAKLLSKPKKVGPSGTTPVERVGDWEAEVELDVPADCKTPHVSITFTTPNGPTTALQIAVISPDVFVEEKEHNGGYNVAQVVKVPCTVVGRIDRDRDTDVYRIDGQPGDKFRVQFESQTRGSAADLLLTATDVQGHRLKLTRESTPNTYTVTIPPSGSCCITLMESSDLGGPYFGYLLDIRKP